MLLTAPPPRAASPLAAPSSAPANAIRSADASWTPPPSLPGPGPCWFQIPRYLEFVFQRPDSPGLADPQITW